MSFMMTSLSGEADFGDLKRDADRKTLAKVKEIIEKAIKMRASDIHAQPEEDGLQIRVRVDGIMMDLEKIPFSSEQSFIAIIKIACGMDITERRRGQDGRFTFKVTEHEQIKPTGAPDLDAVEAARNRENTITVKYDIRVSSIPSAKTIKKELIDDKDALDNRDFQRERLALRILDKRKIGQTLQQLGFTSETRILSEKMLAQPKGLFLITGPSGSGKSTTTIVFIQFKNQPGINILTIENPVEYTIPNISHTEVSAHFTFADALRNFVRQDPDVILVGEMRDAETAAIAMEAAGTGHLIISTLHTNDAVSAISRLQELEIEPCVIARTLNGVLAQRLVRRVCPICRTTTQITPGVISQRLGIAEEKVTIIISKLNGNMRDGKITVTEAVGCDECFKTGYNGRIGVYELFVATTRIREMIRRDASVDDIRRLAEDQGMKSLIEDGLIKVFSGETTIEELERVVKATLD